MLSTGQLLVTIFLVMREVLYPIGAAILLRQWYKGKARYYSDLPFLFAIALLIMCSYTPIEIYYIAFYPGVSIESPFGQVMYLIDLNLIAIVLGINLVILLLVWFPKKKSAITGILIGWIAFAEFGIFMSAFVNMGFMDVLLVLITLPTYIIIVITFFFCYYQKRLPNVHPFLIALGFTIVIISQFLHPIFSQFGIRLGGIYSDASWPAMIVWLVGFSVVFVGFMKKAPYYIATKI